MFKLFKFIVILLCFIMFSNIAFGQCGDDGTKPCPSTKKPTTTKKTPTKPPVTKPKTTTKTPTKQACAPPTSNNDAPSNFTQTVNGVKFEMVGIPSGSFCKGSNDDGTAMPVHRVTIGYTFYVGKYEVTQAQWKAVIGNNPSYFPNCGGDCPVEKVSWNNAKEFINKLNNMQSDYQYRLLSESEWEYTCRAGTTGDYYGDINLIAWYESNSGRTTHPVGRKQPNSFGLYDMIGNVYEWVEDIDSYERKADSRIDYPTDGSPFIFRGGEKNAQMWIRRGGSFARGGSSGDQYSKSFSRILASVVDSNDGGSEDGFRLAVSAK